MSLSSEIYNLLGQTRSRVHNFTPLNPNSLGQTTPNVERRSYIDIKLLKWAQPNNNWYASIEVRSSKIRYTLLYSKWQNNKRKLPNSKKYKFLVHEFSTHNFLVTKCFRNSILDS